MEINKTFHDLKINDKTTCSFDEELKFEPELEEKIRIIAHREGFLSYNVERKLLSNVGGNYLGILYEVNLKGKTVEGQMEINLFLKKIIMDDKIAFMSVSDAYTKEIYVYCELANVYKELQEKVNVPNKEMFEIVKCYNVLKKENAQCLLLENLSKKGYITCNRFESVCPKFAQLAITDLAKFHALGYVLEQKKNSYFNNFIKPLKIPFVFDEKWTEFVKSITVNSLDRINCNITRGKVEKFIENKMIKKFPTYYEPTNFSTLCHGDFRANNILVKVEDGKFTKTMVVDYQLIYYGCPLNDFFYFIFGATDQKFRQAHLENLKNLYYDTMRKFLEYFNINLENVYPKAQFERQYRERIDFGLAMALFSLPLILAPEGDVPDFSKTELTDVKISTDGDVVFKERILGVIDDFLKWGYL